MTQAVLSPLNPGTTSGTQLAQKLENFEAAWLSMHSGSTAPAYAVAGTLWRDTSGAVWVIKQYDGEQWIPLFAVVPASDLRSMLAPPATVASASTTDVLGQVAETVVVTGTNTIVSFGSAPQQMKFVRFAGALTITRNATSLETPTGADIVTAAGDCCLIISDGAGNARIAAYWRAATTTAKVASVADYLAGTAGNLLDPSIRAALNPVALTDAATIAWNLSAGVDFEVSIAGNRTLDNPSGFVYRQTGVIAVTASGAQRTLAKSANIKTRDVSWPIVIESGTTAYIYYHALSATHINAFVLNNPR